MHATRSLCTSGAEMVQQLLKPQYGFMDVLRDTALQGQCRCSLGCPLMRLRVTRRDPSTPQFARGALAHRGQPHVLRLVLLWQALDLVTSSHRCAESRVLIHAQLLPVSLH